MVIVNYFWWIKSYSWCYILTLWIQKRNIFSNFVKYFKLLNIAKQPSSPILLTKIIRMIRPIFNLHSFLKNFMFSLMKHTDLVVISLSIIFCYSYLLNPIVLYLINILHFWILLYNFHLLLYCLLVFINVFTRKTNVF